MGRLTTQQRAGLSVDEAHELLQRRLSRRGLLRGTLAGAGGAALSPLLWTRAAAAEAAPLGGGWIGFGDDPSTTMHVNWEIRGPVRTAQLRYGADGLDQRVDVEVRPWVTVLGTGERTTQYYAHATLEGLEPGARYRYRVEHGAVHGAERGFTTAPARTSTDPFVFTAIGDQSITDGGKAIQDVIGAQRPAFHLIAGDIAYADKTGRGLATDDYEPSRWTTYFRRVDTVSSQVPWMVAVGNHEMEAVYGDHGYGGHLERFQLPRTGPRSAPAAYAFTYANVGFVSLDANDVSTEIDANAGYSAGSQTSWLRETLLDFRNDDTIDFVVAYFHQCAYSTCDTHGSDEGVRTAWPALFDEFDVDLVINGHNHVYERTDPLRGGSATREAAPGERVSAAESGTTYVVAGGGGAGLGEFEEPAGGADEPRRSSLVHSPDEESTEEVTWSRTRYDGFSLLAVTVRPGQPGGTSTMEVRALDHHGDEVDAVTLTRERPASSWLWRPQTLAVGGLGVAATAAGVAAWRHRSQSVVRDPELAARP